MTRHPVIAYCRGVLDGSVVAGTLVQAAVRRHIDDLEHGRARGLYFDRAAAEHAVLFFGWLKHTKGEWAGQVFAPEPWQQFILWSLFGWRRADGLRRFRTAFVTLARKNGKSQLAAAIGLYLLTMDSEPAAEIYSCATKRDQAKIVWEEAVRMAQASKELRGMVKLWKTSSTLVVEATRSKFQPLGADADTMDGLNVHGAIIDEVHAHKTANVVNVLETATGARRQPLTFEITTAGYDRESICYDHYTFSRQILSGAIGPDRSTDPWFAFIAEIDEKDSWQDEAVWGKANPNLGISVKLDDLRRKAEKAAHMPSAQNAFIQLHCNQWTNQSARFIDLALWEQNNLGPVTAEGLAGRRGYGGLDLSSVSDITAWVLVFPRGDDSGALDIWCRFWCPESRLTDSENRYAEQYQAWHRAGLLETTPGNAIDYAFIKQAVLEDASRFAVVDVNIDRLFQGYQLGMELADEGLAVLGFAMGAKSFGPPFKTFERLLLDHKLNHGGHPVLRWMAANLSVRRDVNDNLAPDKKESQGKVDGIVALVMALDRWERNENQPSVYEARGILSF